MGFWVRGMPPLATPAAWDATRRGWAALYVPRTGTSAAQTPTVSMRQRRPSLCHSPCRCGLSLSYALSVTNTLGWSVRMIADTETAMNAVERTQHYTELEPEPQTRGVGGVGRRSNQPTVSPLSIECSLSM